jgi:hypothetical protein
MTPRLEMHSDLKVSAAAADDDSCQDNEKHNCGGDGPPIIFAPPWVGPPAIMAATRTTSILKVWVYHFRVPRQFTDKAKRVEPVPGSKGIKKAPASFPRGLSRLLKSREASPDAPTLSQSTDHTRATKSLSKKCRSLSKKLQVKHPSALNMTSPTGDYRRKESGHEKARSMPWKAGLGCPLP